MKKFTSYLKEFLVITFSITIAFWVENFRENRNEYKTTQALLVKLRSEMISQEGYLKSLVETAEMHSRRFDSLLMQLKDCRIISNQLLVDISLAYLPYVTDVSESSSFESLKNSGLLSNIKNDTLVPDLFISRNQIKRNLNEYNEAWKKSQERLRNVLTAVYGNLIRYDFEQSKLLVTRDEPVQLNKETCAQLAFELTAWITIMKQHSIWIEQQRLDLVNYQIPQLSKEISID